MKKAADRNLSKFFIHMQAQTLPYSLCLEAAKGLLCPFRHHDKLLPEALNQGRDNRVSIRGEHGPLFQSSYPSDLSDAYPMCMQGVSPSLSL